MAGASAPAPQEPSRSLVLPCSLPRCCCQAQAGKRGAHKSDKSRSRNIRQCQTKAWLFPPLERTFLVINAGQRAEIPGEIPISIDLFVNHSYCWISKVFCFPSCLLQWFFKLIIPDLALSVEGLLCSCCTSHIPSGCGCFQDPPKASPSWQEISEHLSLSLLFFFNFASFYTFLFNVSPGMKESIVWKSIHCCLPRLDFGLKSVQSSW